MARSDDGRRLTRSHQQAQLAVRAAVMREVTALWSTWPPGDVAGYARFVEAAATVIGARHQQSAGLAAEYYRAFRRVENVGGVDTPRIPRRLVLADVAPSLRATGLAGTMRAIRAGFSPQAAARSGLVQVTGSAGRLAASGGRATVVDSSRADPRAQGWVRVTSSPCGFCAMLASRGPVFKSERSAGFQAHDHCSCSAEPFYRGSEVPAANRRYAELWDEVTKGLSGADARNAFRKAVEA